MIRPYLSFYWSNWPHLFIETCLYELFVLINALGMEGGAACVCCLVSDGCSNFRENIFYTLWKIFSTHANPMFWTTIILFKELEKWIDRATAKAGGSNENGIICRLYGCLLALQRKT